MSTRHPLRWPKPVVVLLPLLGLAACTAWSQRPPRPAPEDAPRVTHGVAAGEVRADGAVIWGRCSADGILWVALDNDTGHTVSAPVSRSGDDTGRVRLSGLEPDTTYAYRVWCSSDDPGRPLVGPPVRGTFRTAPPAQHGAPVRFIWGGDVAGQNACRDRDEGYAIFNVIGALHPDFFIGLGDMIYADNPCAEIGRYGNAQIAGPAEPATDLAGFWAYWRYNRADAALQRVLAAVPYYAVWDDHEVMNDFGPYHDTRSTPPYVPGRHLMPLGLQAFLDYNPYIDDPRTPKRLYRSMRWGRQVELFLLDTRQYRDPNWRVDDPRDPKTMLGLEQRTWLKENLRRSDARWKIIVSSVPISIPTGVAKAHDGWANVDGQGFQYELLDILRTLQQDGINNTLWITTDAHFVAAFRYTPFAETPAFHTHEIVTGPLNAGVLPKAEFSPALGAERLFLYPDPTAAVHSYAEVKAWFNFGMVDIDEDGTLTVNVINANGATVYRLALPPAARAGGVDQSSSD